MILQIGENVVHETRNERHCFLLLVTAVHHIKKWCQDLHKEGGGRKKKGQNIHYSPCGSKLLCVCVATRITPTLLPTIILTLAASMSLTWQNK